ncbi:TrkA family potassium uptake protein [Halorubrum sp. SD690R]|uniref:potassium channel family protein n=1 Tax=Halorubrum sp. SD690R TaxID=2518117 RepID=UPI0010FA1841|nr:NAD-binding protein [Halorubrum sp. SD690R]TKX43432.1 TrkA family potassium uptake protein [Halorubrum sp. SD690R]
MDTWKRRVGGYIAFVAVVLVSTTVSYRWGMRVYENDPRTLIESFQFAIEMFTTTGFGGDASSWQTQEMHAFIAVMDLVGMVLLIGALPVVATPLLESAFSTTVPRSLDADLSGHVVVASDTTRSDALLDEFDSEGVTYVVVEPDPDRALALYEAGHMVIRADPETTAGLESARLGDARALVTDLSDRVDASIVLAAKELSTGVRAISVVEDPSRERYHRLAGADEVLSPRSLLGESLASKVTTAVRTDLDEAVAVGDLRIAEVSIHHGSGLAGSTLAGSRIGERTGVDVIGAWFNGAFEAAPPPDATLSAGTVLLVSGTEGQVERLVNLTNSAARRFGAGETVVIGHGQVGKTVANALESADLPVTVVDRDGAEAIDVVGDATEPDTLRDAGVADARTVVLALPDDTTAEFATLVVRDLAPNVELLARVEDAESVPKMHRAGADYVLSLSTVTGRMSASAVLADRDVLSLDTHVEVVRTEASALVDRTVGQAAVRETTGCTVIAIERGDELVTDVGPETRVERGDELVVVGTDEGVRAFERAFA